MYAQAGIDKAFHGSGYHFDPHFLVLVHTLLPLLYSSLPYDDIGLLLYRRD